jgi:hypothetical protein
LVSLGTGPLNGVVGAHNNCAQCNKCGQCSKKQSGESDGVVMPVFPQQTMRSAWDGRDDGKK